MLDFFGWYRRRIAVAAYALTILLYLAGVLSHHDAFARSVIALAGALLFATAALLVLIPAWREFPANLVSTQLLRSFGWTLAATGVALLGALVVVGVLSSPLTMEEIERFRGVRLILALPPLIALGLYLFDSRFGSGAQRPRDVFLPPVLTYQLLAGIAVIGLAALMLVRSGNESDISPSPFEIALRHALTHVLSVRPRFKTSRRWLPVHDDLAGPLTEASARNGLAARARDRRRHRRHHRHVFAPPHVIGNFDLACRHRLGDRRYTRGDRHLDLPARRTGRLTVRLLISGYYGFGNLGDEALLEVIVERVRGRLPRTRLEVLSATPQTTTARYGIEGVPRWDWREVRSAIARADAVLSGGGGLLQNSTSLRSLMYYAGILREAIRARKKTMVFAQSVGPLDFWGRLIVRQFCRGLDRATVRDERSRVLLAELLPETPIERSADPVFLYEKPEGVDLSGDGLGPESGDYAVISVRKSAGFAMPSPWLLAWSTGSRSGTTSVRPSFR